MSGIKMQTAHALAKSSSASKFCFCTKSLPIAASHAL